MAHFIVLKPTDRISISHILWWVLIATDIHAHIQHTHTESWRELLMPCPSTNQDYIHNENKSRFSWRLLLFNLECSCFKTDR
jgi:hypothetical protein